MSSTDGIDADRSGSSSSAAKGQGLCRVLHRREPPKDFRPHTHHRQKLKDANFDYKISAYLKCQSYLQHNYLKILLKSHVNLIDTLVYRFCRNSTTTGNNPSATGPSTSDSPSTINIELITSYLSVLDKRDLTDILSKHLEICPQIMFEKIRVNRLDGALHLLNNFARKLHKKYLGRRTAEDKRRPSNRSASHDSLPGDCNDPLEVINMAYNKYFGEVIDTICPDDTLNLILFIENADNLDQEVFDDLITMLHSGLQTITGSIHILAFSSVIFPMPLRLNQNSLSLVKVNINRTEDPWVLYDSFMSSILSEDQLTLRLPSILIELINESFIRSFKCIKTAVKFISLSIATHFSQSYSLLTSFYSRKAAKDIANPNFISSADNSSSLSTSSSSSSASLSNYNNNNNSNNTLDDSSSSSNSSKHNFPKKSDAEIAISSVSSFLKLLPQSEIDQLDRIIAFEAPKLPIGTKKLPSASDSTKKLLDNISNKRARQALISINRSAEQHRLDVTAFHLIKALRDNLPGTFPLNENCADLIWSSITMFSRVDATSRIRLASEKFLLKFIDRLSKDRENISIEVVLSILLIWKDNIKSAVDYLIVDSKSKSWMASNLAGVDELWQLAVSLIHDDNVPILATIHSAKIENLTLEDGSMPVAVLLGGFLDDLIKFADSLIRGFLQIKRAPTLSPGIFEIDEAAVAKIIRTSSGLLRFHASKDLNYNQSLMPAGLTPVKPDVCRLYERVVNIPSYEDCLSLFEYFASVADNWNIDDEDNSNKNSNSNKNKRGIEGDDEDLNNKRARQMSDSSSNSSSRESSTASSSNSNTVSSDSSSVNNQMLQCRFMQALLDLETIGIVKLKPVKEASTGSSTRSIKYRVERQLYSWLDQGT